MNKFYPVLFSPIKIGKVNIRNRIELCPMTPTYLGPNFEHYRHAVALYESYARGGAGLITIGEAAINTFSKTHNTQLTILNPACDTMLSELVDAINSHGATASIELNHGGIRCTPAFNNGAVPLGPVTGVLPDGQKYEAMTVAQMTEMADIWAEAFVKIKKLGFNMGMIHVGHGWQIAQFLSPLWNKRTDEYGGSLENRARFPIMIIDRIRKKVGEDFPLSIRISGDELTEGGFTLDDCVRFVQMIQDKIDICHVSVSYIGAANCRMVMPSFYERGKNLPIAAVVKKNVRIPVACVGALADPQMMEDALASGMVDMVAMARSLIADFNLPNKAMAGKTDEIDYCIRCYYCIWTAMTYDVRRCAVNPIYGREYENKFIQPLAESKNVLVIGGGPAGMKAAITAAERGHKVTLVEKNSVLGGALQFADHIAFKNDIKIFRDNLATVVSRRGVNVMLNTEATADLVKKMNPDRLIVAVGAEPVVPAIPGVDGENVVLAGDIFNENVKLGKKIIIVGGGLLGCETAVHLASEGREVAVVEMLDEVAVDGIAEHKMMLLDKLRAGVKIYTGTRCVRIDEKGIVVEKDGKEVRLDAESVILAVGYKPLQALADELYKCVYDTRVIGDAFAVRKIYDAVRSGYQAGMDM